MGPARNRSLCPETGKNNHVKDCEDGRKDGQWTGTYCSAATRASQTVSWTRITRSFRICALTATPFSLSNSSSCRDGGRISCHHTKTDEICFIRLLVTDSKNRHKLRSILNYWYDTKVQSKTIIIDKPKRHGWINAENFRVYLKLIFSNTKKISRKLFIRNTYSASQLWETVEICCTP